MNRNRFYHLRQCLEGFLAGKLPPKKAIKFVRELKSCSSESDLKLKAKGIALVIDPSASQQLLELIDEDRFLEVTF